MKILIFYTYNLGPLSSFFHELSVKLSERGHEVTNFFLKHRKEHFHKKGIHIYGEKRRHILSNYYATYKIIKQIKPDVIVSNFSYVNPALLFGYLSRSQRNICWFHTVYGHSRPNWLKVMNKRMYLKLADAVIANSKILKGELNSIYKFDLDKIYAIPFWTNIGECADEEVTLSIEECKESIYIGCPGRLVKDKNHSLVIDALAELKKTSTKPIKLFIAGNGPYEKDLKRFAEDKGLVDEVVFLGLLTLPEMRTFYKRMNVVVLPSLNEAFGLVFIEAISLGTPVIVSSQFGSLAFLDASEFNPEQFTFDPKSKESLIKKLEPYIDHTNLQPNYFKKMYDKTFDKEKIFEAIASVIINDTESIKN